MDFFFFSEDTDSGGVSTCGARESPMCGRPWPAVVGAPERTPLIHLCSCQAWRCLALLPAWGAYLARRLQGVGDFNVIGWTHREDGCSLSYG